VIVVAAGALGANTVVGVAVQTPDVSAAAALRNDGGVGGGRGTWFVVGKIFQITPHRLRFSTPITVIIPFDEGNQPTYLGNSEKVILNPKP
jgi:hypothetical protein